MKPPLYTDDIAAGESWLWLAPIREATRRDILDAYAQLADAETDAQAALNLMQAAIRVDPYGENLYRKAMRLAVLGNEDGVQRHWPRSRKGLLSLTSKLIRKPDD